MKRLYNKIQKEFTTHFTKKHFKIDFLMNGNLEPLHTTFLEGKSEEDVKDRFNRLDLESRRDIVAINVC